MKRYADWRLPFLAIILLCFGSRLESAELIHLWTFDGDTQDSSGSGNHGVIHDGTGEYVPGRFGHAIRLDKGAGVMAEDPCNVPVKGADAWSMSIWLNLVEVPDKGAFIAGFTGRSLSDGTLHETAGRERAITNIFDKYWFWGNFFDVDSGQTYAVDGRWHMYTVTYDGANIIMYVDAVEIMRKAVELRDAEPRVVVGGTSLWDGRMSGLFDDFSIWRGALSSGEILAVMANGSAPNPALASAPSPENGAEDVPADVILTWTPGTFAETHDLYLGTTFADVNDANVADSENVLLSAGQDANSFEPDVLEFGRTYYWRVDEVNSPPDFTLFKGKVWSFTVEPYAYPIENVTATASSAQSGMGPGKTVDGSGLDAADAHSTAGSAMWLSKAAGPHWIQFEFDAIYTMHELWVWNSNLAIEPMQGFGARTVGIEYSTDGVTWIPLDVVPEFARAPGEAGYEHNTVVGFEGVAAKYVKLNIESNWGGIAQQTSLSEVRFFHIPDRSSTSP